MFPGQTHEIFCREQNFQHRTGMAEQFFRVLAMGELFQKNISEPIARLSLWHLEVVAATNARHAGAMDAAGTMRQAAKYAQVVRQACEQDSIRP